jgi:hypothetical protein
VVTLGNYLNLHSTNEDLSDSFEESAKESYGFTRGWGLVERAYMLFLRWR